MSEKEMMEEGVKLSIPKGVNHAKFILRQAGCHKKRFSHAKTAGLRHRNPAVLFADWRRGRDLNPGYPYEVYSLSRGAPSAARPPLHTACPAYSQEKLACMFPFCQVRERASSPSRARVAVMCRLQRSFSEKNSFEESCAFSLDSSGRQKSCPAHPCGSGASFSTPVPSVRPLPSFAPP